MRIAPRALLCGNAFRVHVDNSGSLFQELQHLCAAGGDKMWLAVGMVGLLGEHNLEVLGELGYTPPEIAALRTQNVI